mmetsp:Transcript_42405/g.68776  ORF Transcript_42405/g.68776 Transcript_42405/m.68776 type:complete len:108 (+) Transcript_42405:565-888(+)
MVLLSIVRPKLTDISLAERAQTMCDNAMRYQRPTAPQHLAMAECHVMSSHSIPQYNRYLQEHERLGSPYATLLDLEGLLSSSLDLFFFLDAVRLGAGDEATATGEEV